MPSTGRASIAGLTAGVGHGMVFFGFLQPWVAGQFGARDRLSGLDLVRITDGLIDHGLAGDVLTLPVTRVLLFAVPIAAANALLLLVLARVGIMERAHARHLVSALALPTAFVVIVAHVLLVLAARGDSVIDGPAFGLLVTTAGALLAAGSWSIERRPSRAPTQVIEPLASPTVERTAPEA